jgi:signal transduction histidine kinase
MILTTKIRWDSMFVEKITKETNTEEIGVSVAARVIYQLGEQLISDEFVALAELIKNSYDADCTRVRIEVDTKVETKYGKGRIIIEDNGNGMTKTLLTKMFLTISTSFKKVEKYSPHFNRKTLGEKGLGRLSIQRLGNHLTLTTSPRIERLNKIATKEDINFYNEFNEYNLSINWEDFKDAEGDISSIKAKCSYGKNLKPRLGTKLVIEGIRNLDFWKIDQKTETRIKSEIFGMVSPFTQSQEQKFKIVLIVDDKEFTNELIDENVLDLMSDIKVNFEFNNWILKLGILIRKRYFDRHVQELVERMKSVGFKEYSIINQYNDKEFIIEIDLLSDSFYKSQPFLKNIKFQKIYDNNNFEKFAYPGDFKGVLYVSEQSPGAIRESQNSLNDNGYMIKTIKEIKSIWESSIGVYLFRNDFRIFPYGPNFDWLGFTHRSQRLKANSFKEHTVSGYIDLDSKTSENLLEQTNRNGLIADEYGRNFFTITRDIIAEVATKIEIDQRSLINIKSIEKDFHEVKTNDLNIIFNRVLGKKEEKKFIIDEVKSTFNNLYNKQNKVNFEESVKAVSNKLEKLATLDIEEEDEIKQDKFILEQKIIDLQAMVGLAGQGIIIESLTHELHRIESNISENAKESKSLLIRNNNNNFKDIIKKQESILLEIVYLQQQLKHLEPTYRRNRLLLTNINIKSLLTELYLSDGPMSRKANKNRVNINIYGTDFTIQANKGMLITIFDNLFLNSLYWVSDEDIREINFEINQDDRSVIVHDTGPGVHYSIEKKLFNPYESMKKDGRGLGLYIVKELMKSLHGSIDLDNRLRNGIGNLYKFNLNFPQ